MAGYSIIALIGLLLALVLVVGWIASAVWALIALWKRPLDDTTKAIWTTLIVVVPFLGALAFLIVKPGR